MTTMTTHQMTVGDLKKHKGPIKVWVNFFGEDGEYLPVSKAAILKAIGADVPFSRDGMADFTTLAPGSRVEGGVLYID